MPKFSSHSLLLFRRAYTVAAETAKMQPGAVTATRKLVADQGKHRRVSSEGMLKDEFWMRDPKTGNWIPESHFREVHIVDVRENLLSNKSKF